MTEEPGQYSVPSSPLLILNLATLKKNFQQGLLPASTYFLYWLNAHADTGLSITSVPQLMEELKVNEEDIKGAIGSLLMQGHLKIANGCLEWYAPLGYPKENSTF
jgi:hypothetical protein